MIRLEQSDFDMLVAARTAVQAEITAGKTEDQAVADKPLAPIGALFNASASAGLTQRVS